MKRSEEDDRFKFCIYFFSGTAQNTPIKIDIGIEISNNTLDEIDTGLDKANTTFFNNSLAGHLRQPLSNLSLPDKVTTENVTETPNKPIPTYVRTTQDPIVIKPTHGTYYNFSNYNTVNSLKGTVESVALVSIDDMRPDSDNRSE